MTTQSWAGWYRDRHGSEALTITADGTQLHTRIRGVDFAGAGFDSLGPVSVPGIPTEGSFPLDGGALCDFVLEWDMPVPVASADGALHQATLSCLLSLKPPEPDLGLALHLGGAVYASGRAELDFGSVLDDIRRQLPYGEHLQTSVLESI
ncbi:hypothetical protein A8W25_20605 [Streptomyces sp. ERV7]|uniref:DUF6304 family protein n=1 Tax=Streptomyces sp. ERV7 TaxID=1322334 RepID=UPI0007F4BBFC|nr:DUF6304 family protein [Streptomyces sp. ERV7]OAR24752.1 hypothetical protein A8W25_20605 [Streptomyces sp. ERV7]